MDVPKGRNDQRSPFPLHTGVSSMQKPSSSKKQEVTNAPLVSTLRLPRHRQSLFLNDLDCVSAQIPEKEGNGAPLLHFLVKVPPDTDFLASKIAFPLSFVQKPSNNPIVVQPFLLENAHGDQLFRYCLFSPYNKQDRAFLSLLNAAKFVCVLALADTPDLHKLGVKLFDWPKPNRKRIQQLLSLYHRKQRSLKDATFGREAKEAYLDEYKQSSAFSPPIPPPIINVSGNATSELPSFLNHQEVEISAISDEEVRDTEAKIEVSLDDLQALPLIERYIWAQRRKAARSLQQSHPQVTSAFWHLAQAEGARMARPLLFDSWATAMLAERQEALLTAAYGPRISSFPHHHLWVEFEQPQHLLPGRETAGLYLFAAHDQTLFQRAMRHFSLSEEELQELHKQFYQAEPGNLPLVLLSLNQQGVITWANSFSSAFITKRQQWPAWNVPFWHMHICSQKKCRLYAARSVSGVMVQRVEPCEQCARGQRALLSWMWAFWHLLETRHSGNEIPLDEWWYGLEVKQNNDQILEPPEGESRQFPDEREIPIIKYRIVRQIDLQHDSIEDDEEKAKQHRNVRRGEERDSSLMENPIYDMPESWRTLRHPRFHNYIREHGNRVRVRPHERRVQRKRRSTLSVTGITSSAHDFLD